MSTQQLAIGIWRVPTSRGDRDNAFLVDGDDGLTLVDVGWASAPSVLLGSLAELGRKLIDVRRILITHAHPDHVRGLAEFRRHVPDAHVLMHFDDAAWLRGGRVPRGGRHGALGDVLDAVPLLHWTPVEPDGELIDGAVVDGSDGLRVIHTPGHSPGHVALLHEPTRTLLTGDAIFNRGRQPAQAPTMLAHDPATAAHSVQLLPVDVTAVGFAHGAPLRGDQVAHYQTFRASSAGTRK
jgi:glyoxylase-like metal-dependent hydrolase (beta-lactamase superfamily II)